VIDRTPRNLAPEQETALKALGRLVLMQNGIRGNLILLGSTERPHAGRARARAGTEKKVQDTLMRVVRVQS